MWTSQHKIETLCIISYRSNRTPILPRKSVSVQHPTLHRPAVAPTDSPLRYPEDVSLAINTFDNDAIIKILPDKNVVLQTNRKACTYAIVQMIVMKHCPQKWKDDWFQQFCLGGGFSKFSMTVHLYNLYAIRNHSTDCHLWTQSQWVDLSALNRLLQDKVNSVVVSAQTNVGMHVMLAYDVDENKQTLFLKDPFHGCAFEVYAHAVARKGLIYVHVVQRVTIQELKNNIDSALQSIDDDLALADRYTAIATEINRSILVPSYQHV